MSAALTGVEPHDELAEQSLLGSLLIDREAIVGVSERLPEDAFYLPANRTIYKAMLGLWGKRIPCDMTTLVNLLTRRGRLDEVGGVAYLTHLLTVVPTAVHAPYYADLILSMARRRDLIAAGQRMVAVGYQAEDEPDYDRLFVEERARIAAHEEAGGGIVSIGDQVEMFAGAVMDRWEGVGPVEMPINTGIYDLDKLLGGLPKKSLGMLLARTSMGKTALMLHMARRNRAVIFTLEMAEEDILNRLICYEAEVPFDIVKRQMLDVEEKVRWVDAAARVRDLPITIIGNENARGGLTTERMELLLQKCVIDQGAEVCFIDHLGHVADGAGKMSAYDRTNLILERLKRMAQRVGTPIVLAGQLNRAVEGRLDPRPRLSDARDSGKIEEYADWYATIFRRQRYVEQGILAADPDLDYWPAGNIQRAEVALHKNRNGQVGTVHLGYRPSCMKFVNMDRRGVMLG